MYEGQSSKHSSGVVCLSACAQSSAPLVLYSESCSRPGRGRFPCRLHSCRWRHKTLHPAGQPMLRAGARTGVVVASGTILHRSDLRPAASGVFELMAGCRPGRPAVAPSACPRPPRGVGRSVMRAQFQMQHVQRSRWLSGGGGCLRTSQRARMSADVAMSADVCGRRSERGCLRASQRERMSADIAASADVCGRRNQRGCLRTSQRARMSADVTRRADICGRRSERGCLRTSQGARMSADVTRGEDVYGRRSTEKVCGVLLLQALHSGTAFAHVERRLMTRLASITPTAHAASDHSPSEMAPLV